MYLKFAFICDYASIDRSGKISACGLFEVIMTTAFPTVQPQFFLVGKLEATDHERGRHDLTIEWRDDQGNRIHSIDQEVKIENPGVTQGSFGAGFVVEFKGLQFPKAGVYEFVIFVDTRFLARVVFAVKKLAPPP